MWTFDTLGFGIRDSRFAEVPGLGTRNSGHADEPSVVRGPWSVAEESGFRIWVSGFAEEASVRDRSSVAGEPGLGARDPELTENPDGFSFLRTPNPEPRTPNPGSWGSSNLDRLLLFSILVLLPASLPAASDRYDVREVKPNIFVWIPEDIVEIEVDPEFPRAGTAGFVVTPEGVVVVDTANTPFHGREILYEIGHRTDKPVKYVVNTDSAGSHILGNEAFVDEQAAIVSTVDVLAGIQEYQRQLAERLQADWRLQARMRGIHVSPPSQTFKSELRLDLPGEQINLISLNAGDSISAVYLPQAKVLFLGDLFENGFLPTFRLVPPRRDIHRWIQTLNNVENWDVDVYVPGYGAPGGKKEVAQFRQLLEWLANQVESRVKARKSLDQVKAELLPQLEDRSARAPDLAAPAIEAVYLQLAASTSVAPAPGPSPGL